MSNIDINEAFEKIGVLLEKEEYERVEALCMKLAQSGYEIPEIYLVRLLAQAQVKDLGGLKNANKPLDEMSAYKKAIESNSIETSDYLRKCNELIKRRISSETKVKEYSTPSFLDTSMIKTEEIDNSDIDKHREKDGKSKIINNKVMIIVAIIIVAAILIGGTITLIVKTKNGSAKDGSSKTVAETANIESDNDFTEKETSVSKEELDKEYKEILKDIDDLAFNAETVTTLNMVVWKNVGANNVMVPIDYFRGKSKFDYSVDELEKMLEYAFGTKVYGEGGGVDQMNWYQESYDYLMTNKSKPEHRVKALAEKAGTDYDVSDLKEYCITASMLVDLALNLDGSLASYYDDVESKLDELSRLKKAAEMAH